jgi:hypothetical protein
METRTTPRFLALGFALAIAACQKTDESFAGSYEGDGVDSQSTSNVKQFTLRIAESGGTVSGTFEIKAIILNVTGIVNGTLSGSTLTLTLTPSVTTECPYRITGTWSPRSISGNYTAFNCFVRSDGTLSLKKQ